MQHSKPYLEVDIKGLQYAPSDEITAENIDDFLVKFIQLRYFYTAKKDLTATNDWFIFRTEINKTISHILALSQQDIEDMIKEEFCDEEFNDIKGKNCLEDVAKRVVEQQAKLARAAHKSERYATYKLECAENEVKSVLNQKPRDNRQKTIDPRYSQSKLFPAGVNKKGEIPIINTIETGKALTKIQYRKIGF